MKLLPPFAVYQLQFPRGLEAETVVQFLRAIASSPSRTQVSLEVVAVRGQVQHLLVCAPEAGRTLQRHLLTHVPGLRLEQSALPKPAIGHQQLVRVRQRGRNYQLDVEQAVAASHQFLEALGLHRQ